jgi:hypothetical protein
MAILAPFMKIPVSDSAWQALLRGIFPLVEQVRLESAELAREYYDSQRALYTDEEEPFPVDLAGYEYEWFEEAMLPAKKSFRLIDTSTGQAVQAGFRVAKEVENGGRRTILNAARGNDPKIKGWARVATGRETCGFCLMLVSRGPVYQDAESAGLDADDTSARELLDDGDAEALDDLMTRWHPNCDCKVVPVFDRNNWDGRDDFLAAKKTWNESTRGLSGRDALNAFRRAIEEGHVDPSDFNAA